jgi:hypothetical protein
MDIFVRLVPPAKLRAERTSILGRSTAGVARAKVEGKFEMAALSRCRRPDQLYVLFIDAFAPGFARCAFHEMSKLQLCTQPAHRPLNPYHPVHCTIFEGLNMQRILL